MSGLVPGLVLYSGTDTARHVLEKLAVDMRNILIDGSSYQLLTD
jgi:hypothetical protein